MMQTFAVDESVRVIAQYVPEALMVLAVVLALLAAFAVFAFARAAWLALVPRKRPIAYYRGAPGLTRRRR